MDKVLQKSMKTKLFPWAVYRLYDYEPKQPNSKGKLLGKRQPVFPTNLQKKRRTMVVNRAELV
jgi:hypothetical protein